MIDLSALQMIQNVFHVDLLFMDFLNNLFVAALLTILYGNQDIWEHLFFVVMPEFQTYRELWNEISLLVL